MGDAALFAKTRLELAWVFGVTQRTVRKWSEDGAPAKTKRGYDLQKWVAWRAEGYSDVANRQRWLKAQRRFKEARADLEELKLDRERARLVPAELAQEQRLQILRWAVGVFERAGSELSSRLAGRKPREVKKIVDDYFNDVRREAAPEDTKDKSAKGGR